MNKICTLTIDAGTTSVKISLFDTKLNLLACSVQEYTLTAKHKCVEAEASIYTSAICKGTIEVQRKVKQAKIAAIGITTQGETMILIDEHGVPLTPFIVWLDNRAEHQATELSRSYSTQYFYEQTGLPEISAGLPIAKAMWLRENLPTEYEKAYKILLLEDYLLFWLTGKFVSEKTIQSSTGWFSLSSDGYWSEAIEIANIDINKLPELLESGTLVGKLTKAAAKQLKLQEDVLVVAGAMDQVASAYAVGCNERGIVVETTGTALVMAACTDSPVFNAEQRVTIYRHVMNGKYLYLPIANTAGMALKWFRDEFCKDTPNADYHVMDVLAHDIEPGCDGLVFLPFLSGSVDPDNCPNARAVFFGATLATKREHFAKSIFEAVGFMLRDFIYMLEMRGLKVDEILSMGGGSRSSLWQQIKADICKIPFYTAQCSEAASQGAAKLAMQGANIRMGEPASIKSCFVPFEPQKNNKAAYDKAYTLYKNLYNAVRPLF